MTGFLSAYAGMTNNQSRDTILQHKLNFYTTILIWDSQYGLLSCLK